MDIWYARFHCGRRGPQPNNERNLGSPVAEGTRPLKVFNQFEIWEAGGEKVKIYAISIFSGLDIH